MPIMPPETDIKSSEKSSISRNQIVVLGLALILIGAFISGRQLGWFNGVFRAEPIAIPSGAPYAEAKVIGAYEGVVLAERIPAADSGATQPTKIEILTDEQTVFAKITSSGPVKISYRDFSEGDVVWVYNRVRSLEETLEAPADPELILPFEEMLKNPRERMRADFVVKVGRE